MLYVEIVKGRNVDSKNRFVNKNRLVTSSWSCQASAEQYQKNFSDWSKADREKLQRSDCASCKYLLPFNEDWGLCNNENSPIYLQTIFEHFKCLKYVSQI